MSAGVVTLRPSIPANSDAVLSPVMAGLKNSTTLQRRSSAAVLQPLNGANGRSEKTDQRQQWLDQAEGFHQQALQHAEQGDFESSARLILQALDCERRAGGLGPQVLQLIKPRG
ncbi:MAG: hypothetical protein ACKO6F_07295 [Cyanobium sp.]